MLPLSMLEAHDFKLGSVMRSVLRKLDKVKFDKLDTIRDAYVAAFADEAPDICTILDAAAFDSLSAVRNLIVHAAGVRDEMYAERCARNQDLPKLEVGAKLELDGQIVHDLIFPAVACCVRLIKAIDDWLDNQPSPPGDGAGI